MKQKLRFRTASILLCLAGVFSGAHSSNLNAAPEKTPAASGSSKTLRPVKPGTAKIWLAAPKRFDGLPAATFVAAVESAGLIDEAAPYAVLRITTVEQGGKTGGDILYLLPPSDAKKAPVELQPPPPAKGTVFGAKANYKRLDATLRIVGGELVLVKDGDPAALAKLGKPSALLAAQAKAAGIKVSKYPKKDFIASKIGSSGRIEKQEILDRFLPVLNAARKAEDAKLKRLSTYDLKALLRNGDEFIFDDDKAQTTWRIVWK